MSLSAVKCASLLHYLVDSYIEVNIVAYRIKRSVWCFVVCAELFLFGVCFFP